MKKADRDASVVRLYRHIVLAIGLVLLGTFPLAAFAADVRTIGVYVALCDNEHQGIVPVPKAIGNGDDPDRNLYWGSAEGFLGVFGKSPHWRKESAVDTPSDDVMRTCTYLHTSGKASLKAFAYRGRAIKACIEDFEQALCQGKYDLVAYIGHNGLMDFPLPLPVAETTREKAPDCIVLCCASRLFFQERIEQVQARPVLLTTQLMYPGAFVLHDVLEEWIKGSGLKAYRAAAGQAYAANQKIRLKAALGVFADLEGGDTPNRPSGTTQEMENTHLEPP